MAGSLNRATLIGNCGKDPEIKTMNNGNRVASFSLATSETWKDKNTGEKKERTDWHNVVVFNDNLIGVIEQYVAKGSKLMVEGAIKTRKYEKDGQDRYTTEIVLQGFDSKLLLLGAKGEGGGASADERYGGYQREGADAGAGDGRRSGGGQQSFAADLDDEIPF